MKTMNKPLLLLLLGAMTLVGGAGIAAARGHGHGGYGYGHGGYDHGYGYGHGGYGRGPGGYHGMYSCVDPGLAAQITPEQRQALDRLHNELAPVRLELKAKRQELKAKIYSGADDAAIQGLSREIAALQAKVTENNIAMHKQLAQAGVPLREGPWHGGRNFHGHGGKGFHRGMGPGGYGPCFDYGPGYGPGYGPQDGSRNAPDNRPGN